MQKAEHLAPAERGLGLFSAGIDPTRLSPRQEMKIRELLKHEFVQQWGEKEGIKRYHNRLREIGEYYGKGPFELISEK